jgi:hypothetical protein
LGTSPETSFENTNARDKNRSASHLKEKNIELIAAVLAVSANQPDSIIKVIHVLQDIRRYVPN